MKKITGDKGLQAHYEIPAHHIGIHWLLMLILVISLIAGIVAVYMVVREKQDESFKRFIQAEKAGVYQGVTMSPLINTNTYKHNGTWIVEIAGAGDEGVRRNWEGK